ncbi:DUF2512 family protein [Ornithinibacillus scapharcae]|uniref:DUF2512 family protein n=1 Tax=Ornithinibacillus scapharcae TaxID=1147159 RepID=UPI0003053D17|nr:DUF2512 family protein [Ornithinibacillus scapharcae]
MNVKAIGIKLIINLIVVFSIFGIFYDASLVSLLLISLITTAVAYVVGDRYLLKRFGNVKASIADFFLAFLTLAVLGALLIATDMPIVLASLFAAFLLTLTEPLLHVYMTDRHSAVKDDRPTPIRQMGNFQTEFAEESDTDPANNKKDPRRDPTQ